MSKIEFEIQRFAEDDDTDNLTENSAAEEEQEQSTNTEGQESEPIPPEFEGFDEEITRDAMAEWKEIQAQARQQEQPQTETETESAPQAQPSQVDEIAALRNELTQLRAQLAQSQRPSPPSAPPPQESPQPQWTPEVIEQFKAVVDQWAMQMTGFTKEDITAIDEFADESDAKAEAWKYARQIAQNDILNRIRQAQTLQAQQRQQMFQAHQANIASYNAFAQKEMAEPDFQQVQQYAMSEYFATLPPEDQLTVRSAYLRIERNTAEPTDTLLIKNYFANAKAAYRSSRATAQSKTKPKTQAAPPNLPKIDQVNGPSANSDGSISNAELERLIETGQLEKIPKRYRDYLENTTAIF